MKTLDEAKGTAIYREVEHDGNTFLVIVMKFRETSNYLALDVTGNITSIEPFRQVFNELEKLC